jgi:hypothetical protein
LEAFPPKQKLCMLQNAAGDVTELSYIKKIGDQDIVQGNPPLSYDSYTELLLSACSTYEKKITLPGKQKRAVYTSATASEDVEYRFDDTPDAEYGIFQVDTDISDVMANVTDTSRIGSNSNNGRPKSIFVPCDEWNKLTQDQKDRLIAKLHRKSQ